MIGYTSTAALAVRTPLRVLPQSIRSARWLAYAGALVFALGWTLALGKDVHWDALNYHLYLGFSALNDRFAQDFFAAGPPSYINPYAHVPLYLMTAGHWPAIAIAMTFAAFHALALWLTFEIAAAGMRGTTAALPQFALLGVVLATMNPILLQGLGSTMADLSTGVLVLGGWLAIVHVLRNGRTGMALVAGALCGIAAALKLSNAVFAIAAFPALAWMPGSGAHRFRTLAGFGIACATGFAAVSLPWAWQLWREFGNPFFPFFNQYFASPDFVTAPLRYERFIPSALQAFVARPFEMLSAATAVHTEPRAPDLRYVALIVALFAWIAATLRARVRPGKPSVGTSGTTADPAANRTLFGLLVGFAVAWCLWLSISGNSRYFLPMACVGGALLALVMQRLHANWPSLTISAILLVIAVQGVQLAIGSDWDREGGPWDGPWLRVDIPERLRQEPTLYLSAGFLSGSAMVPYFAAGSGMINIGGFNVIAPGYPGGERAQSLIARNGERLRLLIPLPQGVVDRASLPSSPTALNVYVRRLGLRVVPDDCEFLRVEGNLRGERRPDRDSAWKSFIACRLVIAPQDRLAYERDVSSVDPIFDRVEDTCPNLFHPRRPATQEYKYWARTYHMGSEMQLFIDDGRVKYFFPLRGGDPIDIGSVSEWQAAAQPFDCSRRTSPAFVNISK